MMAFAMAVTAVDMEMVLAVKVAMLALKVSIAAAIVEKR